MVMWSLPMKAMVSSWPFSPSRPAPPQIAKMEMMKVAMTIHSVGASALTFFLIVFSMISPQTHSRNFYRLRSSGFFQQLTGDDEPLDLRGALVNRKDTAVPGRRGRPPGRSRDDRPRGAWRYRPS